MRTAPESPRDPEHAVIPVVGIGASAGGLQAASRFLDAMPADSGCAFVIILHLDPTRESALAQLLGRHTAMPVVEAADGMAAEPNRVHAIVPDRTLTICDGALRLSVPAEPRGHRHPIDVFFETLAEDCQERAIGIVLSGTGNNGTHGLREIKARGGMTLVQDLGKRTVRRHAAQRDLGGGRRSSSRAREDAGGAAALRPARLHRHSGWYRDQDAR